MDQSDWERYKSRYSPHEIQQWVDAEDGMIFWAILRQPERTNDLFKALDPYLGQYQTNYFRVLPIATPRILFILILTKEIVDAEKFYSGLAQVLESHEATLVRSQFEKAFATTIRT